MFKTSTTLEFQIIFSYFVLLQSFLPSFLEQLFVFFSFKKSFKTLKKENFVLCKHIKSWYFFLNMKKLDL